MELLDWLWPDAEGDKAAAPLKVAIHRLREWLGTTSVLAFDGRISLNLACLECDAWRTAAVTRAQAEHVLEGFDYPPLRALRRRLAEAKS